jgi:hypothetical protein
MPSRRSNPNTYFEVENTCENSCTKHTHFLRRNLDLKLDFNARSPSFATSNYCAVANPISSGARNARHSFSHLLCPFLLTFNDRSPFVSFFLYTVPRPQSPPPGPVYFLFCAIFWMLFIKHL